jgi:hypothetical protein
MARSGDEAGQWIKRGHRDPHSQIWISCSFKLQVIHIIPVACHSCTAVKDISAPSHGPHSRLHTGSRHREKYAETLRADPLPLAVPVRYSELDGRPPRE